jgi:hypothetical protein
VDDVELVVKEPSTSRAAGDPTADPASLPHRWWRSDQPSPLAIVSVLLVFVSFYLSTAVGVLLTRLAQELSLEWSALFTASSTAGLVALSGLGAVAGFMAGTGRTWSRTVGQGAGMVNTLIAVCGIGLLILEIDLVG